MLYLFQIVESHFKGKRCPLYAPPKNGALTCNVIGGDPFCQVQCHTDKDFVFNPPLYYFCQSGEWQFYALPQQNYTDTLPWPDCSGKWGILLLAVLVLHKTSTSKIRWLDLSSLSSLHIVKLEINLQDKKNEHDDTKLINVTWEQESLRKLYAQMTFCARKKRLTIHWLLEVFEEHRHF